MCKVRSCLVYANHRRRIRNKNGNILIIITCFCILAYNNVGGIVVIRSAHLPCWQSKCRTTSFLLKVSPKRAASPVIIDVHEKRSDLSAGETRSFAEFECCSSLCARQPRLSHNHVELRSTWQLTLSGFRLWCWRSGQTLDQTTLRSPRWRRPAIRLSQRARWWMHCCLFRWQRFSTSRMCLF